MHFPKVRPIVLVHFYCTMSDSILKLRNKLTEIWVDCYINTSLILHSTFGTENQKHVFKNPGGPILQTDVCSEVHLSEKGFIPQYWGHLLGSFCSELRGFLTLNKYCIFLSYIFYGTPWQFHLVYQAKCNLYIT